MCDTGHRVRFFNSWGLQQPVISIFIGFQPFPKWLVYGIVWHTLKLKLILGELPKKALVIPSGWRWPGWWNVADLGTAADSPQRQERRHQLQMPQKIWAPNLLSHQSQPNPWEPRKNRGEDGEQALNLWHFRKATYAQAVWSLQSWNFLLNAMTTMHIDTYDNAWQCQVRINDW